MAIETKSSGSSGEEKSAWNLSQQIIFQIANLLQSTSRAYLAGDLQGAFFKVREVKILIYSALNPSERKFLADLESKIATSRKLKLKYHEAIMEYREQMMILLDKYGYGVGKKKDSTKMF